MCDSNVVETVSMSVVLQVQIAQDADLQSVTESLHHLHQHATIVTSLKSWLHVLHVSVVVFSTNLLMISIIKLFSCVAVYIHTAMHIMHFVCPSEIASL